MTTTLTVDPIVATITTKNPAGRSPLRSEQNPDLLQRVRYGSRPPARHVTPNPDAPWRTGPTPGRGGATGDHTTVLFVSCTSPASSTAKPTPRTTATAARHAGVTWQVCLAAHPHWRPRHRPSAAADGAADVPAVGDVLPLRGSGIADGRTAYEWPSMGPYLLAGGARLRHSENVSYDPTIYRGSAAHYGSGRPPYSAELQSTLAVELGLDGTGRLLDAGCGPGILALRLAALFEAVVGLDPDADMLAEAARQAAAEGITNVTWVHALAEDLPDAFPGPYRLVTFGQSFH